MTVEDYYIDGKRISAEAIDISDQAQKCLLNYRDVYKRQVLRQSMQLIAAFPMLAVYAYHAYCHYEKNESMYIHRPCLLYTSRCV